LIEQYSEQSPEYLRWALCHMQQSGIPQHARTKAQNNGTASEAMFLLKNAFGIFVKVR